MPKDAPKTIDLTPTWVAVLPIYLEVIERGNAQGRKAAREELTRMAGIADAYMAALKAAKAYDDAMNDAERSPTGDDYNELLSIIGA